MATSDIKPVKSETKTFKDLTLSNDILKQMNEYRRCENHDFCDWELESSDGMVFPVHKIVIASACPYFYALFNTQLSETRKSSMVLQNICGNTLEKLINYMYSGEIEINNDNMKETFENASYLLLNSLQNFIADCLESTINDITCLDLWRFAEKNVSKVLSEKCINYILKNGHRLFTPDFFSTLVFDEIQELIKQNTLNCPEEIICEQVIKWIKNDYEKRKKYIEILLNEIRFPLLKDEFMLSFIYECNLIKCNDIFSMKIHETFKTKLKLSQNHILLNKSIMSRYGGRDKKIFTICGNSIQEFSNTNMGFIEKAKLMNEYLNSASTIFNGNLLFACGGGKNDDNKKECQFYCPIQNNWKKFLPMSTPRSFHGAVNVYDKIYVCGGEETNSVVYFDLSSEKWVNSLCLLPTKHSKFGICAIGNCIYTVNGISKTILRRDIRENLWIQIATTSDNFIRACSNYNSIYCFTKTGGKIFDIKNLKFNESTTIPNYNISRELIDFDVLHYNNEIYLNGVYFYDSYYCTDHGRKFLSYELGKCNIAWRNLTNDDKVYEISNPAICMMYS